MPLGLCSVFCSLPTFESNREPDFHKVACSQTKRRVVVKLCRAFFAYRWICTCNKRLGLDGVYNAYITRENLRDPHQRQ